ncbi:MAG: M28 family peptidase [Gemmatimonadales bacterium]
MSKPRELLDLLLSNPREAGTDGALQARRVLSEHLSQLGFDVEEQPFRFSAASLTAYPLFGAGLGWLMLIQILLLTAPAAPSWAALVTWGVGVVALGVLLAGVSLGWAPLGGQVRDSANLIATRGGIDQVRRWIVAHYDTKAQGISLAGRLVAMMYAAAVVLLITVLAVMRLWGPIDVDVVAGAAVVALIACGLAGRGGLRGSSPGARDNATGLLAAITLAQHDTDPGTGFLFTSAEQFGLVGSRIFALTYGTELPGAEVINLDILDDRGPLRVWYHTGAGAGLAGEVAKRLQHDSLAARTRRTPLLLAVDSVPLARSGAAAVTVTRFDWSTLRLVHTARDEAEGLDFATAEAVGRALAQGR